MIILSSSSRRRRKRKSVFLRGGVVSHYHLSSRIVEHLYHVVQLLLYLPASVLPPFFSFSSNTTPRAARFPRVFQSREKERENGRRQVSLRVAGRTRRVCGQERPNGLKIQTHGRIPAWARPLGAFSFLAGTVAIHDPRMKIRTSTSKRFRQYFNLLEISNEKYPFSAFSFVIRIYYTRSILIFHLLWNLRL